jgi:hypothetical protein
MAASVRCANSAEPIKGRHHSFGAFPHKATSRASRSVYFFSKIPIFATPLKFAATGRAPVRIRAVLTDE